MAKYMLLNAAEDNINHLATNLQLAYLAARMLMRTTNIMAHLAGQYLSAYECDKIEEYYLDAREKCYKSIPIRYEQHQRVFQRFLLPATNDIILADNEINCAKPVQIFMRKKSTNHIGCVCLEWVTFDANYIKLYRDYSIGRANPKDYLSLVNVITSG